MTERLYYTEPSRRTFDARIARAFVHEGRPAVALDKTAFYPTSGGQPFDTGRLNDVDVIETIDADDEIVHVLSAPLQEGSGVRGEIDWVRRFDHMQQHTGQHVLSAAFDRLFENRTMSFHMGADVSTIDLAREMTPAELERAVDEANRIVWEDRPVAIRFASAAEAATLGMRKESTREGTLRLIEIPDFDLSACGGTHVDRTGVIGAIAVITAERFRGGTRVTFVCGGRVVRQLRLYRDAVAGSIRVISVLPAELPGAIERMQSEARDQRKTLKGMQEQLASHEAARLVAAAPEKLGVKILVASLDGWDPAGLKAVAAGAVAAGRVCAVLVSSGAIVVARSPAVSVDANALLRQLTQRFGGKGGGKPDMAQGGGLTGLVADITTAARDGIESSLASNL